MTPGHAAYLDDCAKTPNYHTGERRRPWDELAPEIKRNWEQVRQCDCTPVLVAEERIHDLTCSLFDGISMTGTYVGLERR